MLSKNARHLVFRLSRVYRSSVGWSEACVPDCLRWAIEILETGSPLLNGGVDVDGCVHCGFVLGGYIAPKSIGRKVTDEPPVQWISCMQPIFVIVLCVERSKGGFSFFHPNRREKTKFGFGGFFFQSRIDQVTFSISLAQPITCAGYVSSVCIELGIIKPFFHLN